MNEKKMIGVQVIRNRVFALIHRHIQKFKRFIQRFLLQRLLYKYFWGDPKAIGLKQESIIVLDK
jgi:hypothetical protein